MKLWIYKHFKWNLYEVIWIWKHTENLEEYVIYKSFNNVSSENIWLRPKSVFLEEVDVDWIKQKRFIYIWNQTYENV